MKFLKKARVFVGEMASELKKASWPSRQELCRSAFRVLVGMVALGVFVWSVDTSLHHTVDLLMRCAGR